MLKGYGTRTSLIRAATMYAQQHPCEAIVQQQKKWEIQNFDKMVQVFLLWRDEIRHPNPEHAVIYGMMMVASTVRELFLANMAQTFESYVPVSLDHLQKELSRAFLRYLGVETA
jgi:hypothetical protein